MTPRDENSSSENSNTCARLLALVEQMKSASALVDDCDTVADYQMGLLGLAMSARRFLKEGADELAAALRQENNDVVLAVGADSVRDSSGGHADICSATLLASLQLKKTVYPIHGHSTCAADPELVLWRDIEQVVAALRRLPPQLLEEQEDKEMSRVHGVPGSKQGDLPRKPPTGDA